MSDIRVTMFRKTFFLPESIFSDEGKGKGVWTASEGYEEVVRGFYRHRIAIKFSTAHFDDSGESGEHEGVSRFLDQIREFCDENATGYWTWHQWYHRNRQVDVNNNRLIPLDTGDGQITLFFEQEADWQEFMDQAEFVRDLKSN
jgi:hypothetical protein